MGEPAYKVDMNDDGLTVHVRPGLLDRRRMSKFLDYLILETAREQSQLTEEEAAEIAKDIDRAVWERLRTRFEEA